MSGANKVAVYTVEDLGYDGLYLCTKPGEEEFNRSSCPIEVVKKSDFDELKRDAEYLANTLDTISLVAGPDSKGRVKRDWSNAVLALAFDALISFRDKYGGSR